ncbi:MAG: hypothetical protein JWP09_249 [Candidatus Taylorbacteria bacterium]|nr:hypothetical protein [Candidatus Taylorbacteria bacterium]
MRTPLSQQGRIRIATLFETPGSFSRPIPPRPVSPHRNETWARKKARWKRNPPWRVEGSHIVRSEDREDTGNYLSWMDWLTTPRKRYVEAPAWLRNAGKKSKRKTVRPHRK